MGKFIEKNQAGVRFLGTRTSPEEAQFLGSKGFVHITGLQTYVGGRRDKPYYVVGDELTSLDLGRHGYNNGKSVVVTLGGEVWLAQGYVNCQFGFEDICTNGNGAFVPLSNGEQVLEGEWEVRKHNPSYGLLT